MVFTNTKAFTLNASKQQHYRSVSRDFEGFMSVPTGYKMTTVNGATVIEPVGDGDADDGPSVTPEPAKGSTQRSSGSTQKSAKPHKRATEVKGQPPKGKRGSNVVVAKVNGRDKKRVGKSTGKRDGEAAGKRVAGESGEGSGRGGGRQARSKSEEGKGSRSGLSNMSAFQMMKAAVAEKAAQKKKALKKAQKKAAAGNDDDGEIGIRRTAKERRAIGRSEKVKYTGTHFYKTANVKNRNR